jgi:hypothetical protein
MPSLRTCRRWLGPCLVVAAFFAVIAWLELPREGQLTRGNFYRVRVGMTLGEVEALLGPHTWPEYSLFVWKRRPVCAVIDFRDGRVVGKEMHGTEFVYQFKWYLWRITGWDVN